MRLATVSAAAANGVVRSMYDDDLAEVGYVRNATRAFSLNPEAFLGWGSLSHAIRRRMRLRRYELATIAAATALDCRYCVAAHAAVLVQAGIFEPDALEAVVRDPAGAGLPPVEVAVMALARTVARRAGEVTDADIDPLRAYGLGDEEIFDVVLTAAARTFFSQVLEAVGAAPDPELAATHDLLDRAGSGRAPADRC
jgi:uncharacterized peroxidase-related enzyme